MKNIVEMKKNIFALLLLLLPLAALCQDGSRQLKDKLSLNDTIRIEEIADTSYVIWNKDGVTCYNKEDTAIFKFCELEMKQKEPLCNFTVLSDSVRGTIKIRQQQLDTLLYIRYYFLKDSIPHANGNDTLMLVVDRANSIRVYSVGKKTPPPIENKHSWLVWVLGGGILTVIIGVLVFLYFRFFRQKMKLKKLLKSKRFTVKLTTNDISGFKDKAINAEDTTGQTPTTTMENVKGTGGNSPIHDGNVEKDEISQLNKKLKEYEKVIEEFQGKRDSDSSEQSEKAAVQTNQDYIDAINDACEFLRSLINEKGKVKDLDTQIETIKKELKEQNDALKKEKQTLITKNECLEKLIERVQDSPESLKGESGYNKLTKLIEKAERCDDVCKYPDSIDEDTEVGKLIKKAKIFTLVLKEPEKLLNAKGSEMHNLTDVVRKGLLLDKVKKVPDLIASDKEFAQTPLQDFIVFIDSPEKINRHNNLSSKGLYKLVDDIMRINKNPGLQSATYPWLNTMLSKAMENSSQYIQVQNAASSFGNSSDLSALTGQVQTVFQYAKSYLQFAEYKNYWKNLQSSLLVALNQLPSRNETDNMRVMLFYVSQLYSMTCIMGKIYGDLTQTTSSHLVNVTVFNSNSSPNPGPLGFPSTAEASFKDFTFQYLNAPGEVEMINYLKKYQPLPFIFLNSYYDNSALS